MMSYEDVFSFALIFPYNDVKEIVIWDVPRKQLYLIAFVDLVPVATEKVSLIR